MKNLTLTTDSGQSIQLTQDTAPRKGNVLVFKSPSFKGSLRLSASAVGADGEFVSPGKAKSKMSKEERAAARAALTPLDKARIAKERADKAIARAKALAAAAGIA